MKGSFGLYGNNITINGGKVTGTDEGDTETLVVGSKGDISFNGGSVDVKSCRQPVRLWKEQQRENTLSQ